jgi:glycosyltransferase involved in cell wall biosynthesis
MASNSEKKQTVCLSMIVKNEAPVIRRCLESVKPLIDAWVIVDTGSTDGTQEIIKDCLRSVPGELFERPWQDFAHNRSEALTFSRPRATYSLIIDADDAFELPDGYELPELTQEAYTVDIRDSGILYRRMQLVRNSLPWRYAGVLHEFLTADGPHSAGHLDVAMRRNHDGARRRDPKTYQRDAALLERALLTETDPFMVSRYTFYLAQSYKDCGEQEKALQHYLARAELGFWEQEVYISLYRAAQIEEARGRTDEALALYARASDVAPYRAEALHGASRLCRHAGRNEEGYAIGKKGLGIHLPGDGLFTEPWIYHYGLKDEFAINAYWSDHFRASLDACISILTTRELPEDQRPRVAQNARFAFDRLPNYEAEGVAHFQPVRSAAESPMPLASPALLTNRSLSDVISVITPTRNREDHLQNALAYFRSQDCSNLEWLILDDSEAPARSFEGSLGANIHYEHVGNEVSIGEKRNRLIEKARGSVIVHFDDDDYYAPAYVSTMAATLFDRQADLINLRGWYLFDNRNDFFGYWDLMNKQGPHFRCDHQGVAWGLLSDDNNGFLKDNHLGYGFSYVFRRSLWESVKFRNINWNEDGEFSLEAAQRHVVTGAHDSQGLCLHNLHEKSTSRCFPQHQLPLSMKEILFPRDRLRAV